MTCLRTMAVAAICLGLSFSSGCNVYFSENPLSDERDSPPDLRLVGEWKMLHPDPGQNGEMTRIVVCRGKADSNYLEGEQDHRKSQFTTTKIGKLEAISLRVQNTYVFYRYEIRDDCVGLWGPNMATFGAAIKNGELKKSSELTLENSTAELRKFIEDHGEECFTGESDGRPTVYYRVKTKTE